MKLQINKEFQNLLWPLTTLEYALLEESIKKDGCRDPIVVTGSVVIDGHNRYSICQRHGIPFLTSSMCFGNVEETKEWIDINQLGKRNLTNDQLRTVRGRTYNRLKKEHGSRGKKKSGQIDHSFSTSEQLVKEFGVSERTIRRDAKFAEEVESDQLLQKALKDKTPVKQIIKERKLKKRKEEIEGITKKIKEENVVITSLFDVVVIDPPWQYSEKGMRGEADYDPEFRGVTPYPTMALSQIENIKLPLKKNAVVFLWTTHAFLHDAFHLLDKWGLEYKATMVWDKERMGLGMTVRLQCEFCLIAKIGKPLLQGQNVRDIIREPGREHSRKPEAFYKAVEQMTVGNRLDYFAREQRKGWQTYGIEANKF